MYEQGIQQQEEGKGLNRGTLEHSTFSDVLISIVTHLFWWRISSNKRRLYKYLLEISLIWFHCERHSGIWRICHDICTISWKMDTKFWVLVGIGNRFEKVSKNTKFKYLYPIEVRNHGIYVWNRFHFERVENTLSHWKILYIYPFWRHFFR